MESITVICPEIYFGELTNTDVYVKTRRQEFNYRQGQTYKTRTNRTKRDNPVLVGKRPMIHENNHWR